MSAVAASGGGQVRSTYALVALALGAFVIGTAEVVIVGVLNLVAAGLKVPVGTAGLLVTAYALGAAVGGPVVTAVTIQIRRQLLLALALVVFVLGNLIAVFATSFGLLLAARVITGAIHGLFIGVACAVAAALVPAERRGQAVSMVFGGIAVSTVLGAPLGTLIGQQLGRQAAFAGVVILGVVALAATVVFVPAVEGSGSGGLASQARHAFAPRVLAMLGVGLLLLGGQFTVFTYLAPFFQQVTGISGSWVSAFMLIFGVASAVGTFAGGKFADANASATLLTGSGILVLALGGLYLIGANAVLVGVALAAWGLVGFGIVPSFQLRVISLAGPGADLAATLGNSAVNIGIAAGAAVGGATVSATGVGNVPLIAAIVCLIAVPATWASRRLRAPQAPAAESTAPQTATDKTDDTASLTVGE
jgi:DHA1 family inner membrane transport protein